MTTPEDGFALHELTPDQFPFRLRFFDMDTEELLHEITVRGIRAVAIPGWAPRRVKCEMTLPNGMQYIEGPGLSEARQIIPPPRI